MRHSSRGHPGIDEDCDAATLEDRQQSHIEIDGHRQHQQRAVAPLEPAGCQATSKTPDAGPELRESEGVRCGVEGDPLGIVRDAVAQQ